MAASHLFFGWIFPGEFQAPQSVYLEPGDDCTLLRPWCLQASVALPISLSSLAASGLLQRSGKVLEWCSWALESLGDLHKDVLWQGWHGHL